MLALEELVMRAGVEVLHDGVHGPRELSLQASGDELLGIGKVVLVSVMEGRAWFIEAGFGKVGCKHEGLCPRGVPQVIDDHDRIPLILDASGGCQPTLFVYHVVGAEEDVRLFHIATQLIHTGDVSLVGHFTVPQIVLSEIIQHVPGGFIPDTPVDAVFLWGSLMNVLRDIGYVL
jgi:hypothetical protein